MGYTWPIYYLYLLNYLLLPFPVEYPSGNNTMSTGYLTGIRVINYPDTAALPITTDTDSLIQLTEMLFAKL